MCHYAQSQSSYTNWKVSTLANENICKLLVWSLVLVIIKIQVKLNIKSLTDFTTFYIQCVPQKNRLQENSKTFDQMAIQMSLTWQMGAHTSCSIWEDVVLAPFFLSLCSFDFWIWRGGGKKGSLLLLIFFWKLKKIRLNHQE